MMFSIFISSYLKSWCYGVASSLLAFYFNIIKVAKDSIQSTYIVFALVVSTYVWNNFFTDLWSVS